MICRFFYLFNVDGRCIQVFVLKLSIFRSVFVKHNILSRVNIFQVFTYFNLNTDHYGRIYLSEFSTGSVFVHHRLTSLLNPFSDTSPFPYNPEDPRTDHQYPNKRNINKQLDNKNTRYQVLFFLPFFFFPSSFPYCSSFRLEDPRDRRRDETGWGRSSLE